MTASRTDTTCHGRRQRDGTSGRVTAVPNTGYRFVGWSDGVTTAAAPTRLTGDISVTANFAIDTYTLTARGANGTITGDAAAVAYGASQAVTAVPNTGYSFVSWSRRRPRPPAAPTRT